MGRASGRDTGSLAAWTSNAKALYRNNDEDDQGPWSNGGNICYINDDKTIEEEKVSDNPDDDED